MFSNFTEFMVPAVFQQLTGDTVDANGDVTLTFAADLPVVVFAPKAARKKTQKYKGRDVTEHLLTYVGFDITDGDRIVYKSKTYEVEVAEDRRNIDANYVKLNMYLVN